MSEKVKAEIYDILVKQGKLRGEYEVLEQEKQRLMKQLPGEKPKEE